MYLLDTNACIRILNGSSQPLIKRLHQERAADIYLCAVVKAELLFGAHRSSREAENLRTLERFFEPFISLPFDDSCSAVYGRLRSELVRRGTPIGPNDTLIAATAIANQLTLITANRREFSRVVGLAIENWESEQ